MKKSLTASRIIGIDFDDVLMDFNGSLCRYHNKNYGTNFTTNDVFSFDLQHVWKCSQAEVVKRMTDFYQTEDHAMAPPVEGAIEAIHALRQNHRLIIVSAKPEFLREQTLGWLGRHFPSIFDTVHFTNQFLEQEIKETKATVCRNEGISVFVDDSLRNAAEIASLEIPVLLFNRPWNQGGLLPNITRVHSWKEIVEKILFL